MPTHKYQSLHPPQLEFIRRLERGAGTSEQIQKDMKITGTVFGRWLQRPVFVRRYQRALAQVYAHSASLEASAKLDHARQQLTPNPDPPESPKLDPQSALTQRLLDLHGSESAAIQKIRTGPR